MFFSSVCNAEEIIGKVVDNSKQTKKYFPSIQTSYRNDFGYNIAHIETIVPLVQNSSNLFFGYANSFTVSNEPYGYGIGLGYRHLYSNKLVLGSYALIDRQRTDSGNHLYQAVFGFEALAEDWDFRINYDLPEECTVYLDDESKVSVQGTQFVSQQALSKTMYGGNIEAGYKLPWDFITKYTYDTRVYAGTFYNSTNKFNSIISPYVSTEIKLNNPYKNLLRLILSVGGDLIWEDRGGTETSFFLKLNVPFGKKYSSTESSHRYLSLQDRMVEPLRRRRIKIKEELFFENPVALVSTVNGKEVSSSIYFAQEGVSGDGTVDNPMDLSTAIASAGENGIIVLQGDGGEIVSGSTGAFGGGTSLQEGQILLGGGSSITLQTLDGRSIVYTAPGLRPTIINENPGDSVVLNAAQDSLIKGVEIDGDISYGGMTGDSYGVYADSVTGVKMEDVNFKNLDYAAYFQDSSGVVEDSLVEDIAECAIVAKGIVDTSNITVQNTTFQGAIGDEASPVCGAVILFGNVEANIIGNNISATNFLTAVYAQTSAGDVMNITASDNEMDLPVYYSAGFSVYNTGGIMNLSGTGNTVVANPVACAPLFFPGTGATTSTLEVNGVVCY